MFKLNSIFVFIFIFAGPVVSLSAINSRADVVIIANSENKTAWDIDELRKIYLGVVKPLGLTILDQAETQKIREEFYIKFVAKNPSEIKRKRSILIFSGEKVPLVLPDDSAVFDHVKKHENAIGYVSKEFMDKEISKTKVGLPASIFIVK